MWERRGRKRGQNQVWEETRSTKGVSKAVGIEKLVERINRNIDDTIAFGDGRNDIEMLETVNIGVAMGNAVDEAKAVANYETDRIENDGIVKALKHFELI